MLYQEWKVKRGGGKKGQEFFGGYRPDNLKILKDLRKRPKLANPYWICTE